MDVVCDAQNDYFISLSEFKTELAAAGGALANETDTEWVTECAVIVSNPSAHNRRGAIQAHIKLQHNSTFIKVLDKHGNETPSQVVKKSGKEFDILFIADVEALGLKVYDVVPADRACETDTDLKVSEHVLENDKYIETMQNLPRIVREVQTFLEYYASRSKEVSVLHPAKFRRR